MSCVGSLWRQYLLHQIGPYVVAAVHNTTSSTTSSGGSGCANIVAGSVLPERQAMRYSDNEELQNWYIRWCDHYADTIDSVIRIVEVTPDQSWSTEPVVYEETT